MKVQCIAKTEFFPPHDVPWKPETSPNGAPFGGPDLVEFAGRACYQSWSRPNPETATRDGYLKHILTVGHYSVLEHGSISVYITGVSRSLTHELVRHRHFSYSQLSQRYVKDSGGEVITPSVIASGVGSGIFSEAIAGAHRAYLHLVLLLEEFYQDREPNLTLRRKLARQAARSVLPNATETKIVVTGNYRAWRHFLHLRATEHADVEIRELAVACLRVLWEEVPGIFNDFSIYALEDGTEVASTSVPGEV
jgi:thymidylate synthase (FAD)